MVGLCRLCASLRKMDVLITVKDNTNEILDKLRKCCQLNIEIDDPLPKSICQECISNLNNSYKFYTKVQEAQETLQAFYPLQEHNSGLSSITQTLSTQEETSNNITNAKQEESEVQIEYKVQSENSAKGLKTEIDKENQQIKEDIQNSDFGVPYEMIDSIEDVTDDLEDTKSPPNDGVDQIEQEDGRKDHTLDMNDVQYDLVVSEEKDSQSNEVIQRINDLLSDDEINVEIEYMEYLEDEEEENYEDKNHNIEETFETKKKPMHNSYLSYEIKISSWTNYKYLCFICDNIFNSFIDLKEHVAQEHNIIQLDSLKYKCYDCRKSIARYSFFLNHVRARHHPDLKLKCDACDSSCHNFNELTQHRSVDCVEAKNFVHTVPCSYCFKTFNNTYGLQNHMRFQHISSSKIIYKCKICDKEFQYKSCLKSHERLHSDTKHFCCDYCDKSFHTKLGLEQHLYAHVEEKSFLCNICHRSYKSSKSLNDHRKLHTDGNVFQCQFCSRAFGRKIQQITHERTHTGEMPFSCEQCEKRFRYRSALFAHNKIHSGHKPYACDFCEKTFADGSNRNKHVRRMHSNDKTLENKID